MKSLLEDRVSVLGDRVQIFITQTEALEIQQRADLKTKAQLEQSINELIAQNKLTAEELDLAQHAIVILREVSDEAVKQSYDFITDSINAALERIFDKTTRKIKLHEYTRNAQYPQLEIELTVESGKTRSLKADSGHGLMQIISLLCILSLIVITHSRKILVIDEIISGLSSRSRRIVAEILWTFTTIGFQFITSEHGFIPKGAKVYHLQMDGGVSHIENEYIEQNGVYLDGALQENPEYHESHIKVVMSDTQDGEQPATNLNTEADDYAESSEEPRGEVQGEIKSGNVIQI